MIPHGEVILGRCPIGGGLSVGPSRMGRNSTAKDRARAPQEEASRLGSWEIRAPSQVPAEGAPRCPNGHVSH